MSAPAGDARGLRLRAAVGAPVAALLALALVAIVFRADIDPASRAALDSVFTAPRLAMLALLLLPLLAALAWLAARLHGPLARLTEGTRLIAHGNPAHRIHAGGPAELAALAGAVNELAERRAELLAGMRSAVEQARARVEQERNRFAALLSELDQSVLVCNREGRILLYNAAVSELLDAPGGAGGAQAIGLGRSAFGVLGRDLVQHALEALEAPAARGERGRAQFVATTPAGRLLRVSVAPVTGGAGTGTEVLSGFVLLLTDVTEGIESDARSIALFQDLVQGTRSAIAGIRAAVDAMAGAPQVPPGQGARVALTVRGEVDRLSERLDSLGADVATRLRQRWPLEEVRGADVLGLACRRIERRAGMIARAEGPDAGLWLRVDSFSLVQAVSNLAGRLQEEFAVRDVRVRLAQAGGLAHLDLAWKGVPMSSETAFHWQNETYTLGGEDDPLSLAQVMDRHGGEAWYQRDAPSQTNFFRLVLPLAPERAPRRAGLPAPSRPEFYDFDLFGHSPATDALDQRRLADLAYTVFDTETTGLDPDLGDEILSIGAARIVNRRLLRSETFDALVDPRRGIPEPSIAIHGITPARVAGQPVIGEVLPRLWRFAEDTVLVGHNAAFDMRFLQRKEGETGVRFAQPVLDTLLLAAVVQPSEASQSLESLAKRLGIALEGRHTALGDALVTGEIFLALLPLLAAQGIHTLGEARAASETTYYARLHR
jgi:DNA polymerase-3 subunit epsilon